MFTEHYPNHLILDPRIRRALARAIRSIRRTMVPGEARKARIIDVRGSAARVQLKLIHSDIIATLNGIER